MTPVQPTEWVKEGIDFGLLNNSVTLSKKGKKMNGAVEIKPFLIEKVSYPID